MSSLGSAISVAPVVDTKQVPKAAKVESGDSVGKEAAAAELEAQAQATNRLPSCTLALALPLSLAIALSLALALALSLALALTLTPTLSLTLTLTLTRRASCRPRSTPSSSPSVPSCRGSSTRPRHSSSR
jgi:hypothetical protein